MSYNIYTTTPTSYGNITLAPTAITGPSYSVNANGTSASDLTWSGTSWTTAPVTITQRATIDLKGDDADVVINGESLRDSIKEIKEALRIPSRLARDEVLEKNWSELQAAAEHYEKLLKEYKEKQKVWDALKTQDQ